MEYYSTIKKNEILPFATMRMGLERNISEKDKYCMISLMCGISATKRTSIGTQRERRTKNYTPENKLMGTRGAVGGAQGRQVMGIKDSICGDWVLYVCKC